MQDFPKTNTLSTGDALFLYFERQGQPVNVASVNVFEGVIPLDACVELIASRLPLIPRYLQRVVTPLHNIDLPVWEYDPAFDIRNHVREVVLRHGTEAELKNMAGKILSGALDRNHPLWDFTLLQGLKGNRTGAIIRMHHCLCDGIAGVGLLNALMDTSPTPPPPPVVKEPFQVPPPQAAEKSLLSDLISTSMSTLQRILSAESELLAIAKQVVAPAENQPGEGEANAEPSAEADARTSLMDKLMRVLPELAETPARLPFNVVCRGPQKFNWAEIPLAEIKTIKDACGATVNDVVLTVVTSTVRRYAELHGVPLEGRRLRIVVPVNVRGQEQVSDCGNRITFFPVDTPLDIADPRTLLDAVRTAVIRVRNAHVAELVGLFGTWLGAIPTALQALAGPIVSELPLSLCNLICTNVPGPNIPLYFRGHRLLSCYPYVPIGGEMGMNCAILTYNGTAYFGFTGDAHAVPDLRLLDGFLKTSFAELQKATGVRAPRRKPARRKKEAKHKRANPAPLSAPSPAEAAVPLKPTASLERPAAETKVPAAEETVAAAAVGAPGTEAQLSPTVYGGKQEHRQAAETRHRVQKSNSPAHPAEIV